MEHFQLKVAWIDFNESSYDPESSFRDRGIHSLDWSCAEFCAGLICTMRPLSSYKIVFADPMKERHGF
jgi:hypothetical protein